MERPGWWAWDLAFTGHVEDRMETRAFSDLELRAMLTDTTGLIRSARSGRWIALTRFEGRPWAVGLEPDPDERPTYVVTAYRRETRR